MLGRPVFGSRTWMCTIAAPAAWAATAESMISRGVIGIAGFWPGTLIPPVIAHEHSTGAPVNGPSWNGKPFMVPAA